MLFIAEIEVQKEGFGTVPQYFRSELGVIGGIFRDQIGVI